MFIVPEKINESALKRRGFKPFFVLITYDEPNPQAMRTKPDKGIYVV